MEENDDGDELSTPFWVQSSTNIRNLDRLRRRISSFFFSSGLVIFILLVIALFFLIFVVPSTLSFSVFRPNSVKKSWDSLNIVLVLVAVVCGFLSRITNNNNENHQENEAEKLKPSNSDQLFNYDTITIDEQKQPTSSNSISEQWNYKCPDPDNYHHAHKLEQKYTTLRKNSNSYPEVREFSSNRWDDQLRSYDDFEVDAIRVSDLGKVHRRHRSVGEVCSLRTLPQIKTARYIDTSVSEKATIHSPSSSPPIGTPGSPEYEEKVHFSEIVQRRKDRSNGDLETTTAMKPPPTPPSVQPEFQEKPKRVHKARSTRNLNTDVQSLNPNATPPSPPTHHKRSRSGATGSATKDFLNSLYQKKKKKKPRQKSLDNLDSLTHQAQDPLTFQPTSPPPAPPLPPPSVFQNLFLTKKQKIKRTITVSLKLAKQSPTPPPHTTAIEPTLSSQNDSLPTPKPPRDMNMRSLDQFENYSNSGGESPLNHIPPPPPPPPLAFFKNTGLKFVMQGDYVSIDSSTSSRSESPDLDEMDSDVSPSASIAVGGDVTQFHPSPLYCPSPDVNTKAESFINNFRANLKLEKNHSMNKKLGLSSLGPRRSPNQN